MADAAYTVKPLSDYSQSDLESLLEQVTSEIGAREVVAHQKWLDLINSPAFASLQSFYADWPGYERAGRPRYEGFISDVSDWSVDLGIPVVGSADWASQMAAKLQEDDYALDDYVDPPE